MELCNRSHQPSSASLKWSRARLYTICYQQVTTQKIAVYLRRTAKREPVTRQLPSRVTVCGSRAIAAVGRPPCPLNCHFIRQP